MPSPHDILGVPYGADHDQIKEAWRKAALKWHPDRNPNPRAAYRFNQIKEAYDALTAPTPKSDDASDLGSAYRAWWSLQQDPHNPQLRAAFENWRRVFQNRYQYDIKGIFRSNAEYARKEAERKKKQWPLWTLKVLLGLNVTVVVSIFTAAAIDRQYALLAPIAGLLAWSSIQLWCHISTRGK